MIPQTTNYAEMIEDNERTEKGESVVRKLRGQEHIGKAQKVVEAVKQGICREQKGFGRMNSMAEIKSLHGIKMQNATEGGAG